MEEARSSAGTTAFRDVTFGDDGDKESAVVRVLEAPNSDFGLFLWPSGEVLARYLWRHRNCPERGLRGCRVLEIGAGVALPALLAANPALEARAVVITDRTNGAEALANAAAAAASNGYVILPEHDMLQGYKGNDNGDGNIDGDNGCARSSFSSYNPRDSGTTARCPVSVLGLSWGCFDERSLAILRGRVGCDRRDPFFTQLGDSRCYLLGGTAWWFVDLCGCHVPENKC